MLLPITIAGRHLLDIYKVQYLIGVATRSRPTFVNMGHVQQRRLLNVGCGHNIVEGYINLDYQWRPGVDVCWDIAKHKYPFADGSMDGIFTEHCLEHISFEACQANFHEFYRMLRPGGHVRLIVPDGEIYADLYQARKRDPSVQMPYGENEPTAMVSINRIFRAHGHQFIYDFETFQLMLTQAGFNDIRKTRCQQGRDARLLVETPDREVESLYVEATK